MDYSLSFTTILYLCISQLKHNNVVDELGLKYGCNPNQKPARIFIREDGLPIEVLNGRSGYTNLLNTLNNRQLVKELKEATGFPAAASLKHVSPVGVTITVEIGETLRKIYFVDDMEFSPMAAACARARGVGRTLSCGDLIAPSGVCDESAAHIISHEVSGGVIAPGRTPGTPEILRDKREGTYSVIRIDPTYRPAPIERRGVLGITFGQGHNKLKIGESLLEGMSTRDQNIPADVKRNLIIALITLKYTQSNSVCYTKDGQAIDIGAGQQSRTRRTRPAGNKADIWYLHQHPKVVNLLWKEKVYRTGHDNTIGVYIPGGYMDALADGVWGQFFTWKSEALTREEKHAWLDARSGVASGLDAFSPFEDNVEHVHKSGVSYITQPGGPVRDDYVIGTCDKYDIAIAFTGIQLSHH